MDTRVSQQNLIACIWCKRTVPCDCRERVGVFLPRGVHREPWRIYRGYARQLRAWNLGSFINHAKDFRLSFVPDVNKIMAAAIWPDGTVGLNHRRLANGVTIRPARRTHIRCLRPILYSQTQCLDTNQKQEGYA